MQLLALILCLFVQLSASYANTAHFLSDGFIQEINSKQDLWKAGRNFPPDTPLSEIKKLMGTFMEDRKTKLGSVKTFDPLWPDDKKIPRRFDARKKWHKKCPRIGEVLDQGKCGSCWAISAAQAFTDRYCIATKGKHQMRLSTANVVSCCHQCGYGCDGGWETEAWTYFNTHGLPSGGKYNSTEGCQPYNVLSPCKRSEQDPYQKCPSHTDTPACYNHCYNHEYKKELNKDYRYAQEGYYLPGDEKAIMKEIMTYGPVTTAFNVMADFINYKSGVYEPHSNDLLGGHAVKLIGWGVEKKVPYWLIMNSWNDYWGDHGLVKMKRNCPEIALENEVSAAVPDTKKHGEIDEEEQEDLSAENETGEQV